MLERDTKVGAQISFSDPRLIFANRVPKIFRFLQHCFPRYRAYRKDKTRPVISAKLPIGIQGHYPASGFHSRSLLVGEASLSNASLFLIFQSPACPIDGTEIRVLNLALTRT